MKFEKLSFVNLDIDGTVEDAGKAIFTNSANHIERNFELFGQYSDPEALLQIRVGLRRIRVALKIFRPVLPLEIRKQLKEGSKYFGRKFGPARDMDVSLAGYLSGRGVAQAHMPALDTLRASVEAARAAEYALVQRELGGEKFRDFLGDLKGVRTCSWRLGSVAQAENLFDMPVQDFAARTIVAGAEHLRAISDACACFTNDDLHKFRRRVKKARYQLRFLISLCESDRAGNLLKALSALQDCLGALRDVVQSRRLVAQITDQTAVADYAAMLDLEAILTHRGAEIFRLEAKNFERLWQAYLKLAGGEQALIFA